MGVVAEDGPPVGAAWLRLLPEQDPGYGSVDEETPELSIGVVPTHRGRGIGSLLLEALIEASRGQRYAALSLSGEPDNPARRLYERHGFQVIDTVDGSLTCCWPADDPQRDGSASGQGTLCCWSACAGVVVREGDVTSSRGEARVPALAGRGG